MAADYGIQKQTTAGQSDFLSYLLQLTVLFESEGKTSDPCSAASACPQGTFNIPKHDVTTDSTSYLWLLRDHQRQTPIVLHTGLMPGGIVCAS